jgi:hypothetical protein
MNTQLQVNDVVEITEDTVYHLDGASAAPTFLLTGTRGLVIKATDQPQLSFEAVGVKFDGVDTPIVFLRHGTDANGIDTMFKLRKV